MLSTNQYGSVEELETSIRRALLDQAQLLGSHRAHQMLFGESEWSEEEELWVGAA